MSRIAPFVAAVVLLSCTGGTDPARQLTGLPRPLSQAEQKVAGGSNRFAFDLFREVNARQRGANVFVSPLSATMALGMTLNGAAGQTWTEMRDALRLAGATQDEVNEGYRDLIALLRGLDPSTEFRIANSIWYRQGFLVNAPFLEGSRHFFDAEVRALNFADQQGAMSAINGWVRTRTNDRIPTIVDQITDEVMFLINAIYFKGTWQQQFDRRRTSAAPFHAADGSTASVQMMYQPDARMRIAQTADYEAADLRYGNSAFSMTIVLPRPQRDVNTTAESLTLERWQALVDSFEERTMDLYLPRFTLTWERDLNDVLIALGMGRAFDEMQADFARMTPAEVFISKVKQKTFVEVNEEGTEAAAATSVGIMPTSAPPAFRVDRPFVFAIRERFSGTILFIGKVVRLPG
jgi:serine protease inhibitor